MERAHPNETPEQEALRLRRAVRELEATVSRLERELGQRDRALQQTQEKMREEQEEVHRLERLLEATYTQLHEHGIEEPARFPITRKAIDLVERLPDTFSFDDAHERYLEMEEEAVAELLEQLVENGILKQDGLTFTKTGHKPYF